MIRDALRIAKMRERAAELVGVPFKLLGRNPAEGLDCVGCLLEVYRAAGVELPDVDPLGIHDAPERAALWQCFDPCPSSRHGMPGDVALWPVDDDGSRWSSHVGVVFGSQLFTANPTRGVHTVDLRRYLTGLAKVGRPAPRWFRLREELAC